MRHLLPGISVVMWLAACGPLPHASTGAGLSGLRQGHLAHLYSDADGVLLHVVVLKPPGATSAGSNGGRFELGWTSLSEETIWRDGGAEHRLAYSYRLLPTRFEIDGRSWPLDDGNVFVVKLDADWKPAVDALPIRITTTNHVAVLTAVQRARPGDAELASLRIVD